MAPIQKGRPGTVSLGMAMRVWLCVYGYACVASMLREWALCTCSHEHGHVHDMHMHMRMHMRMHGNMCMHPHVHVHVHVGHTKVSIHPY